MTTLFGLLGTGATALETNQLGIAVTGNNIANANTVGYNRRDLVVDEGRGASPGGGVTTKEIARAEDFILSQRIGAQAGTLAEATANGTGLSEIEASIQSGQTNLSLLVSDLGSSFTQLAAAPEDLSRRTDVIEKGRSLAAEFNRVGGQLGVLQSSSQEQAQALIFQVNVLARQVAALNTSAVEGTAGAVSLDAAGRNQFILDHRDRAAQQLAGLTGGQVLQNSDGSIDVLVGGQSLVHGAVEQDLSLSVKGGALTVSVGSSDVLQGVGGKLGGVLAVHATGLKMQDEFDRLAHDLAGLVDTQHALGVGLDGVGGRPFFAPLGGVAGAALSLKIDSSLTSSTLEVGFSGQAGDNRNALAMANLLDQPVLEGGKSTFRNVYTRIVSTLGAQVNQAQSNTAIAQGQKQVLDTAMQTVAGVSTDEETTHLLAYQRGYDASAKFISIVNEMMSNLVQL